MPCHFYFQHSIHDYLWLLIVVSCIQFHLNSRDRTTRHVSSKHNSVKLSFASHCLLSFLAGVSSGTLAPYLSWVLFIIVIFSFCFPLFIYRQTCPCDQMVFHGRSSLTGQVLDLIHRDVSEWASNPFTQSIKLNEGTHLQGFQHKSHTGSDDFYLHWS